MEIATKTRSAAGRIEIGAAPERVWKALTDAAELVRWFPLEARVEPGEGGSIFMSWKNEYAGESKIIAWEPMKRLAIAWGWGEDASSQPQVTEYRIEAKSGSTILHVVTSGFPDDPSWDAFVEGTNRGWLYELESLRQYLEAHDGEERGVVYLRRRTALDAGEAWQRIFGVAVPELGAFAGRAFDETAPYQYAAVTEGGLFRISLEPCMGLDARDVTVWRQAWGDARAGLPAFEASWRPLLERLFPEGETV